MKFLFTEQFLTTTKEMNETVCDAILYTGGPHVIRKEAWTFYRTSSEVRLYWELKEPKGPKGCPVSGSLRLVERLTKGTLSMSGNWRVGGGDMGVRLPAAGLTRSIACSVPGPYSTPMPRTLRWS